MALGCFSAVAAVVLTAFAMLLLIVYLESGADTGKVTLEPAAAYAPGSVEFVRGHSIYLVRLPDGEFLALSNLDAANRATPGRQCRVAPIPAGAPELADLVLRYRSEFSPAARGSELVFREDCNGAIYDITGLRLDARDYNLERHPVSVDDRGRVVVDLSERICTAHTEATRFAPVDCP
ncbi:MAG: hypothetical protein Kow0010_25450 [Dehalococcoidia bacterium]